MYTHVSTNWALHAEAIDDERLPREQFSNHNSYFLLKKKSSLTRKVKKPLELLLE